MKDNERLSLADSFADSLKMIKTFWGAAGVPMPPDLSASMPGLPSMLVPTLDVGELDKRIADLRAVEQWLAVNANMLRASIQTLEVQRNTIATLQTLGNAMLTPASGGETAVKAAATPSPPPAAAANKPRRPQGDAAPAPAATAAGSPLDPALWWGALQDQFARIASAAATPRQANGGAPPQKPARRRRARKSAPAA